MLPRNRQRQEEDRVELDESGFRKRPFFDYLGHRVRWALGDKRPLMAYLKVTRRCNLACVYCPWHTKANDFDGELGTEEWKRIITSLHAKGVRLFVVEGGEPTLRSDLQELLELIARLGAHSLLATNCAARDPWMYNPTAFTTSVDGDEETHDKARGKGTLAKVLKRLESKGQSRVFSITVISRGNRHLVERTCELLAGKVDGYLFTFLYPYHGVSDLALNAEEVRQTKAEILELKARFPILNPTAFLKAPLSQQSCKDQLTVSVSHTGNVKHGCFIQHVEPKNCEVCELACFHLVSSFYNFNLESWFNLHRHILRAI